MKKKTQPHDRFVKTFMEDIDCAKSFLRSHYVNTKVKEEMDWDTLELWDTSLMGENNKQLYADVVYRVLTKNAQEAFFIFNHERKPDRLLPIRRLEYKLGTLKKALKQNKQPALIYFITWYNGPVPYPYEKRIKEYFSLTQLAEALLLQDELIVVKELTDQGLSSDGMLQLFEIFMKYADDPTFPQWLVAHPKIANQLAAHRYIEEAIDYLLDVGYQNDAELLLAFEQTAEKLKQTMLTTRQQIEKRGRQEGRQEGMHTQRLEIARNMLKLHLDMNTVHQATGLSTEALAQLLHDLK